MAETNDPSELSLGELRRSDAPQLAKLHLAAFPGFFLSTLGEGFLTEFYRAYSSDSSAITVVARDAFSRPIGAVVGTSEPSGFYSRLLKRRAVWFAAAALRAVFADPRRIPRLIRAVVYRGGAPAQGEDWALLASICVSPDKQGSGLGRELISAWVRAAASSGVHTAFLTTDASNNDSVNRFYGSLGWTLDSTYTTPEGRAMNRYVKTDI